jgi:enterochelin esterase-like enzyme
MGPVQLHADVLHRLSQTGPLESPWLVAGLAALLVASALAAAWRRRLHRRPRERRGLRRAALAGWLALLAILSALAAVNDYVGYVPTLPTGPDDTGSRVETFQLATPALGGRAGTTYVYLPPGYGAPADARHRYPVVYLLHGYPGSAADWFRAGRVPRTMDMLLAERLVQPMIVVAPSASGGWGHDSEMLDQVGGPQVETYLTRDVVHAVDARYRTVADRTGRAIGGMSSGGYGAINLGLRHQDVYSVILAEMPYGDPGDVTGRLLGGRTDLWLANAPDHYIPTMAFTRPMTVYLIDGAGDQTLSVAARMTRMLDRRGQHAQLQVVPGASHSWRGARTELPYSLVFASTRLQAGPTGL